MYKIYFSVLCIITVPPLSVSLKIKEAITENVDFALTCNVPDVYPGVGYLNFKIKLDDVLLATSNLKQLTELSTANGLKSVTYTEPGLKLNRTDNGKSLMCESVWGETTTLASAGQPVNIACKCFTICSSPSWII
jgi:hypothetical protein